MRMFTQRKYIRRWEAGIRHMSSSIPSLERVKSGDRAAYLAGLLLPREAQRGFFAIRALNLEVSRIPEAVSHNEMTARIRFQWWRDLVAYSFTGEDTISNTRSHPLASELSHVVKEYNLTQRWLEKLIDAREADMLAMQPDSAEAFEVYCENAVSPLFYLTLELLGIRNDAADHAASHVGKGVGIATALNSVPFFHSLGHLRIPYDIAQSHGLRKRAFIKLGDSLIAAKDGANKSKEEAKAAAGNKKMCMTSTPPEVSEEEVEKARKALTDAVFDFATRGHLHMEHARQMKKDLPSGAAVALLPATWASIFYKRLESDCQFDIFHPALRNDPFAQVRLQLHLLKNKYTDSF